MADYMIHKGVDKPVEFKGLQSQYLVIFAAGLLGSFLLVVALHLCGMEQLTCFGVGVALAFAVIFTTFRLNARYGRYGLIKVFAAKLRPRRIINRRSLDHLIRREDAKHA